MLVRAGVHHQCRINLADGKATLSMTDADGAAARVRRATTAQTADAPDGRDERERARQLSPAAVELRPRNAAVGQRLGREVRRPDDVRVATNWSSRVWSAADPGDLAPAGVGSRGAAVQLSSLRIFRDKYYIATHRRRRERLRQFISIPGVDDSDESRVIQRSSPIRRSGLTSGLFAARHRAVRRVRARSGSVPAAGRQQPAKLRRPLLVRRPRRRCRTITSSATCLIGKALLIYWPHTWNRPIPFTPNFSRMGPIR